MGGRHADMKPKSFFFSLHFFFRQILQVYSFTAAIGAILFICWTKPFRETATMRESISIPQRLLIHFKRLKAFSWDWFQSSYCQRLGQAQFRFFTFSTSFFSLAPPLPFHPLKPSPPLLVFFFVLQSFLDSNLSPAGKKKEKKIINFFIADGLGREVRAKWRREKKKEKKKKILMNLKLKFRQRASIGAMENW